MKTQVLLAALLVLLLVAVAGVFITLAITAPTRSSSPTDPVPAPAQIISDATGGDGMREGKPIPIDESDEPDFMRGLVPVPPILRVKAPAKTSAAVPPAIVLNLCRLSGAAADPGAWTSVASRAAGMWMNTAGTDDWVAVCKLFTNKRAHLEVTPGNVKKGVVGAVLQGLKSARAGVAHCTWYLGDENIPIGNFLRKGTMAIARNTLRNVTDCVTCLTGRGEWQTVGAGQENMGKPGPPRGDIAGGAYQGGQCSGVTVEMPFEAYDCAEMLRAIQWCRTNNKLCVMLAHTGKPSEYVQAAKRAAEGFKRLGMWPDVIVVSNYGPGSVTGQDAKLAAVPEGTGSDYPVTVTGAARLLLDFPWV